MSDPVYMLEALKLAAQAAAADEVPVGAVVVKDGIIVGNVASSFLSPTKFSALQ